MSVRSAARAERIQAAESLASHVKLCLVCYRTLKGTSDTMCPEGALLFDYLNLMEKQEKLYKLPAAAEQPDQDTLF